MQQGHPKALVDARARASSGARNTACAAQRRTMQCSTHTARRSSVRRVFFYKASEHADGETPRAHTGPRHPTMRLTETVPVATLRWHISYGMLVMAY